MPDLWGEYKSVFYAAQHQKCAYCEAPVTGETGALDHHYPKGAVTELVAAGEEVPDATNVRGRKTRPIPGASGFWWLAYDWTNWCFICNRCNSAWKGALFPAELPPGEKWETIRPGTVVTPLLLFPFEGPDPEHHLEFYATGEVVARDASPHGRATIEVCGLHRESLRQQRAKVAERASRLCDLVQVAFARQEEVSASCALDILIKECHSDKPFAAVSRAILLSRLGVQWAECESGQEA